MGRCSVCGKKILYNEYKVVKGIVYCLSCKVKRQPKTTFVKDAIEKTIQDAKYENFEKSMEKASEALITSTEKVVEEIQEYGIVGFTNTHKLPKVSTAKTAKKRKRSKKRQ